MGMGPESAAPGGKSAPYGQISLRNQNTAGSMEYPEHPNDRLISSSLSNAGPSRGRSAANKPMIDRHLDLFDKRRLDLVQFLDLRQLQLAGAERFDEFDAVERRHLDGDVPEGGTLADLDVDVATAIHEVEGRHGLSGFREWPGNHDSTNELLRVTAKEWRLDDGSDKHS